MISARSELAARTAVLCLGIVIGAASLGALLAGVFGWVP